MSRREPAALVYDVVGSCRLVLQHAAGSTLSTFLTDRKTRDAVERQLLIAGEAVAQLRSLDRRLADELGPVDAIAGFRNLLAHGYFKTEPQRVWGIVQNHVQPLLEAAERVLATLPPPENCSSP